MKIEPLTPDEQWRSVPGHPDYIVSTEGRIGSKKRALTRLIAGFRNEGGYHMVELDGKTYPRHRVVLLAWDAAGRSERKPLALHGPGGLDDNRLENLYWGDHLRNYLDQIRDGTDHLPSVTCEEVGRMQELDAEDMSFRDIAREIGCHPSTVRRHLVPEPLPNARPEDVHPYV